MSTTFPAYQVVDDATRKRTEEFFIKIKGLNANDAELLKLVYAGICIEAQKNDATFPERLHAMRFQPRMQGMAL